MKLKCVLELAKSAFHSQEYKKAAEIYLLIEGSHHHSPASASNQLPMELLFEVYLGYADSLAHISSGSIPTAFDVYCYIFNQPEFYRWASVDRLKNATSALIESVRCQIRDYKGKIRLKSGKPPASSDCDLRKGSSIGEMTGWSDPFLCPVCDDVFKCPVTVNCGHTYCRHCLISTVASSKSKKCRVCWKKIETTTTSGNQWEKDVFISRLVERWWGGELKTKMINEDARHYLNSRHYDEALRCANESLEQGELSLSFWGVSIFVIYWLNGFRMQKRPLVWKYNHFRLNFKWN